MRLSLGDIVEIIGVGDSWPVAWSKYIGIRGSITSVTDNGYIVEVVPNSSGGLSVFRPEIRLIGPLQLLAEAAE